MEVNNNRWLTGKNALITGGNRGVGKAIVREFANQGANIIFNSSSLNKDAEDYAKEISTSYGVECIYVTCNIAKAEEIENMIKVAKEKLKRIDILVNNAGKAYFGSVEELKLEDINESLQINFTAPFLFAQKVIPMMKENKWEELSISLLELYLSLKPILEHIQLQKPVFILLQE